MKAKRILIAILTIAAVSATASAKSSLDNTGRSFGIQFNTGLGLSGGYDIATKAGWHIQDFSISTRLGMRFGLQGKFKVIAGLHVEPVFQLGFYKGKIDFRGGTLNGVPLESFTWSTTHLSFGVVPTYYLRLKNVPIHPFFGLGLKCHMVRASNPTENRLNGQEVKFQSPDGKNVHSSFGFGISPSMGAELQVTQNLSIPFAVNWDLDFSEYGGGTLNITTGLALYF